MEAPRIRTAQVEDARAVLDLWRRAAKGVSISDDEAGVARLIVHDSGALLLAERDGELVGTVIAGFDGWRCHLYRLAVAPEHRRQGVSTVLLTAAETRFAELGGRRGDAMVLDHNDLAHRTWGAAGYSREPQWRRWVKHL